MKMEIAATAADAHDDCLHEAFNELDTMTGGEPDGFISKKEVKSLLKELKQQGVITKKQKKALMQAFKELAGTSKHLDFAQFEELVKSSEPWGKLFEM
jgi:Ca2+-binding EF-hand superfamily protein